MVVRGSCPSIRLEMTPELLRWESHDKISSGALPRPQLSPAKCSMPASTRDEPPLHLAGLHHLDFRHYTTSMTYIFHEPTDYGFRDVNGHHGKFFGTDSPRTNHLIIECDGNLTVSLIQHQSEFNYYVLEGNGSFTINDETQPVQASDLIVIPPGTKYTFSGKMKMLLINTPHWSQEQEEIL